MSAYLITRDGQELGSFEAAQIQEGLKNGSLLPSDWGWREGMSDWQGLAEIAGTAAVAAPQGKTIVGPSAVAVPQPQARTISSPLSAPVKKPAGQKPESLNPYAAPASASAQPAVSGFVVPPDVLKELTGTKPWVRFLSVLMWIGCSVFLLFIVANLVFGLVGGSSLIKAGAAGAGVVVMIGTTIGYGLMALLILYPTLKLSKYASKIGLLAESRSFTDLAAALAEQRRFWKFYGILMLSALFVILMVAGIGSMPR